MNFMLQILGKEQTTTFTGYHTKLNRYKPSHASAKLFSVFPNPLRLSTTISLRGN